MNRFASLLRVLVLGGLMVCVAQAASAEQKIAVVNVQQIMQNATAAAAAREQLKAKQKQFQDEVSKKESDLQRQGQDLKKEQSVLSQEAFSGKVTAYKQKASDVQRDVELKRTQLNKAFESAIATIQSSVTSIIAGLAKERGFNVALPSSQVLYYDASMDITSEVLSRLNKQLPSMKVKF